MRRNITLNGNGPSHAVPSYSDIATDEGSTDDCAIDDDLSEWIDEDDDGGSFDERNPFERMDTKKGSQTSIITSMILTQESKFAPAAQKSRAMSPICPSSAAADHEDDEPLMMKGKGFKPITETTQSTAQPITQTHPGVLSPRTARRNMLAAELSPSLRRELLWERKQKFKTADAVLKRRHTSQDMANLKQIPILTYTDDKYKQTRDWGDWGALEEYHSRGW